jgi:hypothetical protein
MVTWSYSPAGSYTTPLLYMNYNVDSIVFNGTTWTYSTEYTYINYAITFSTPLPSTNYIAIGQAYSPYLRPQSADVIFHPVFSDRTTSSCVLSLVIDLADGTVANWFAPVSASRPTGENTYMNFQIVGT